MVKPSKWWCVLDRSLPPSLTVRLTAPSVQMTHPLPDIFNPPFLHSALMNKVNQTPVVPNHQWTAGLWAEGNDADEVEGIDVLLVIQMDIRSCICKYRWFTCKKLWRKMYTRQAAVILLWYEIYSLDSKVLVLQHSFWYFRNCQTLKQKNAIWKMYEQDSWSKKTSVGFA